MVELFYDFFGKPRDSLKIKTLRYTDIFDVAEFLHFFLLTMDKAFVFDLIFNLGDHLRS